MNTEDGPQEARPPSVEWREYRGHDWLLIESRGSHTAGISIAYGELDEPVEDMGVLRYLAAAMRAELVRPVETGPGHVGFPDVQVSAAPSNLDIVIGGDLDVVAGAMKRLEEFFSRPELPDEVSDEDVSHHYQTEDLVLRFGANSWTLHQPGVKQDEVQVKARSLLARLDPTTGSCAHVLIADDVLLVGCAFSSPPAGVAAVGTSPGGPETSVEIIRSIADDPNQRCGTVLSAERAHELMTAVTANSVAGDSALHLLAGLLDRTLSALPRGLVGDEGLQFVQLLLGRVILFCVSSPTRIESEWLPEIHHRISQLPRVVSDDQVRRAIERARPSMSEKHRAMIRLHGVEDRMDVGVDEVRYAYLQLLDTIHLIDDPRRTPEEGYPCLVEDLKAPRRPGLVAPGWRSMEAPSNNHLQWDCLPHRVAIRGGRLATWVARDVASYYAPRVVDLDHLECVLRDSYGGYRLVDRSGRQATVNPRFLKRGRSLQRRLDAALAGVPVLSCDFDTGYRHYMEARKRRLEQGRRRRAVRRVVCVAPLLLVGGYVFSYWLRMADVVDTTVPLGQSVTLSNGTVARAETYGLRDSDVNPRRHAYVLEMCGGRDTRASNASASSQREMYVDRVLLHWDGSDHSVTPSQLVSDADDDEEWVNVLKEGQCVKRKVAFVTGELSDDAFLEFTNSAGDRIAWQLP